MEGIQFEEQRPVAPPVRKVSLLSGIIISSGLVKDERGAQIVLLIIAVLLITFTAWLILPAPTPSGPSPEEIEAEVLRG
jgi:hypothetical protein